MDDEPIIVEKKHSRLLKKMHGDSYIGKNKPSDIKSCIRG